MASTITRTPEELLAFAFDEVDEARRQLSNRRESRNSAQQRADETVGLVDAAQRQYKNAEAKYRVLRERTNCANTDDAELSAFRAAHAAAAAELAHDEEIQECRAATDKIIKATARWITDAEKATGTVQDSASIAERSAKDAPDQVDKAPLRNAAGSLSKLHSKLAGQLGTLSASVDKLKKEQELKGPAPKVASLRAQVKRTQQRLESAEQRAKVTCEDDAEDKAKCDLEAAQAALIDAPEAEQRARTRLRQATDALAEAEQRYSAALELFLQAERAFIERIDVGEPDANGVVVAEVVTRRKIPAGYQVRWTAEAGVPKSATGLTVNIDTKGVPQGTYTVKALLERINENGTTEEGSGK